MDRYRSALFHSTDKLPILWLLFSAFFLIQSIRFIRVICEKPLVPKLYHEIILFMNILFLRESHPRTTTATYGNGSGSGVDSFFVRESEIISGSGSGSGSGVEGKTFFILKYKFQPHNIS